MEIRFTYKVSIHGGNASGNVLIIVLLQSTYVPRHSHFLWQSFLALQITVSYNRVDTNNKYAINMIVSNSYTTYTKRSSLRRTDAAKIVYKLSVLYWTNITHQYLITLIAYNNEFLHFMSANYSRDPYFPFTSRVHKHGLTQNEFPK